MFALEFANGELDKLKKEAKINNSTLYTIDLVETNKLYIHHICNY